MQWKGQKLAGKISLTWTKSLLVRSVLAQKGRQNHQLIAEMFAFPTDGFGGRRVEITSKITEFTFFGRKLVPAGNWATHCAYPELIEENLTVFIFVYQKTPTKNHKAAWKGENQIDSPNAVTCCWPVSAGVTRVPHCTDLNARLHFVWTFWFCCSRKRGEEYYRRGKRWCGVEGW